MINPEFRPKLFTLLREGISREQLYKDLLSGLIVGIVALPLAIAFAIASGVSPEKGLVTAVVAGFLISALGGSRVQIGGPTGAFIVIVYDIVQRHGVDGLTIATLMGGILLIGMGFARFGNYLKFIPYPLVVGFTSGIALIIFSSQVKDFFGLQIESLPADFVSKWAVYAGHAGSINLVALGIGAAALLITLYFHRITPKVPGAIVAIVLTTLAVYLFDLPVETIESRFGEIPASLGKPHLPAVSFGDIRELIQPAIAIALLGGIESLLSAVVADGMTGGRHRSNMELVGQGIANIAASLFGGIPATGAIARTATNVKNGGRTPVAGIVHAIVLLLVMLFFAPYAKLIPMACLAGVLIVVAYNMSEWRHFVSLLRSNRMDIIILVTTFLLTVFFDLIIAIEVGVVLSSFLFMKRMSESLEVQAYSPDNDSSAEQLFEEELGEIPQGVVLFEINGPLFFGAAQQFQDSLTNTHSKPRALVLRMRNVPFIDGTGMQRLKEVVKNCQQNRIAIVLSGVRPAVEEEFERHKLYEMLERSLVCANIGEAMIRVRELLAQ